jgi:hypothetical protein
MADHITDERIAEVEAKMEGVTPGPWDTLDNGTVRAIDGDEGIPIFDPRTPWKKHRRAATAFKQEWHNPRYVAKLDPDTVKSMISRLRAAEAGNASLRTSNSRVVTALANTTNDKIAEQRRAEKAEAESTRLREALRQAAVWFQDYADGHAKKGDGDKAKRNQERADFCTHKMMEDGE